jgi:hypothetical protein
MFVASPRARALLEIFMNRDRRFALSQELVGKQTLLDQLRALVGLTRYLMSSLRSAPRLFFDGLWRGH